MSMKQRSYEKELLDKDDIPFSDMLPIMQELNVVNTLLGGHNITRRGVDFFLSQVPKGQAVSIAEIGCGGGDNLSTIHSYLAKKNIPISLTGVDIKPECIQYAEKNAAKGATWICSDYRKVVWPGNKPDIIFSSLFCHHFTDEELVVQLGWLKENTRLGFFINDLHRHPVAYHSIKMLTKLLSKSYIVKLDAPLSVKRSLIRSEWVKLFSDAGIAEYSIKWKWAFRYLICAKHGW